MKAPRVGFDHAPTAVGVTADCSANLKIVFKSDRTVDQQPCHLLTFPSFHERFGCFSFCSCFKCPAKDDFPGSVALGKSFRFTVMVAQSAIWIIR